MIVKGIVEEISSGKLTNELTTREFIVISGKTYRKVELSNYMDEKIKVGDNIELSIQKIGKDEQSLYFLHKVYAAKLDNGEITKRPMAKAIKAILLQYALGIWLVAAIIFFAVSEPRGDDEIARSVIVSVAILIGGFWIFPGYFVRKARRRENALDPDH